MTTPTIAQANTINSYAVWLEQSEIDTEIGSVSADDNPIQLSYHEQMLHIYNPEAAHVSLTIYTVTGRVCSRISADLSDGHTTVSLAHLSTGVYVIAATGSNGETQTMKLNVR